MALVIGANDVVNPSAKTDSSSPLYGMPILDAIDSDNVIVIKRGRGAGFSGVENPYSLPTILKCCSATSKRPPTI